MIKFFVENTELPDGIVITIPFRVSFSKGYDLPVHRFYRHVSLVLLGVSPDGGLPPDVMTNTTTKNYRSDLERDLEI